MLPCSASHGHGCHEHGRRRIAYFVAAAATALNVEAGCERAENGSGGKPTGIRSPTGGRSWAGGGFLIAFLAFPTLWAFAIL